MWSRLQRMDRAEGLIDTGAPRRLRALLAGMAKGQLPIFFHSPGGLRGPAMEIGRLLRERGWLPECRELFPGVALPMTIVGP